MYHLKHLNAIWVIATQDLEISKNLFSSLTSSINKNHPSSIPPNLKTIKSS